MLGVSSVVPGFTLALTKASFDAAADSRRWKLPGDLHHPTHLPVGAVFSDAPGLAPEMVVVPGGTFLMGSPDGSGDDNGRQAEEGRSNNEGPRKRIAFDRPFAIGRFAVTVAEFQVFSA
jgi:formylglycine-generating enzyme required for sulfatase activity